jgi:hypothetical protein
MARALAAAASSSVFLERIAQQHQVAHAYLYLFVELGHFTVSWSMRRTSWAPACACTMV